MTTTTAPITPEAVRTVLYRHGFTETEVKGVLAELGEAEAPAVTSRPVAAALRRAKAAEAKLAAIEEKCRKHAEWANLHCPDLGRPAEALVKAAEILAIIGSEEEAGRG